MPLAFDTTGLQRHDERTWFDPRTGDQVSLTYFDLEPDLPASLEELPLLRQRLAHVLAEAGTLVEAHVVTIDSVQALYQVVKLPIPGRQTGLMFVAALTVPKATGSVVLQVLCQEGNTSGIRESMVSSQIGFENCFPPHPYAPGLQGMLPWNVADDQRWDAQFPEHPLSRARAWAHRTIRTARVDPNFARLPPFRPTAQVPEPPSFGGGPTDSQRFAAPDAFGAPPEPHTLSSPTDSQHFTAPDTLDAPPEPQTFAAPPSESQFTAPPESQAFTAPQSFDPPAEQLDLPRKPRPFPVPRDEPPAEQQSLDTPPKPAPFPTPQAFSPPQEPPAESQQVDPPESGGVLSESPRFSLPTEFGAPSPGSERADAAPEPFGGSSEPFGETSEPAPEPEPFSSPPEPAPLTDPQAFTVSPGPQPPAPAAPGDVLHTVLVGVPIGDYLPLWQREGQEDTVTFWRMSNPDAVRARLGTGVESRSAVDTGRYREAAMFSPERQMLFLMDRYRDDSGNLGGTSEQLFPATEDEAYQAADDKALSVLYGWLGEIVLAAARRGEFVAVETGGWDVPVNPVVLVMLRTDGREWHSVVETSPVPVGAPVWRDQQPVEGTSQILASPATDQTLRASGLLTRFAINTWSMHPFQLGISFGPNPTLEGQ